MAGLDFLDELVEKTFKNEKNNIIVKNKKSSELSVVSSGSTIIDCVSSVGGLLVKGRLVEIFGNEGSGKTTLCLQSAYQAQKKGLIGIFIDMEKAFDYKYASNLGLKEDDTFRVLSFDYGEQIDILIGSLTEVLQKNKKALDYIILDSIAITLPKVALENLKKVDGNTGQKALQATFFNEFTPKLVNFCSKYNIAFLATNQLRQTFTINPYETRVVKKSGVGSGFSNDVNYYTKGGNAIKYYYSARYLLDFIKPYKNEDGEHIGNLIKISNVKNKLGIPKKIADFIIIEGLGTDDRLSQINAFEKLGHIYSKGRTWYYKGSTPELSIEKGNISKDNFFKLLSEDVEIMKDIDKRYKEIYNNNKSIEIVESDNNFEDIEDAGITL